MAPPESLPLPGMSKPTLSIERQRPSGADNNEQHDAHDGHHASAHDPQKDGNGSPEDIYQHDSRTLAFKASSTDPPSASDRTCCQPFL